MSDIRPDPDSRAAIEPVPSDTDIDGPLIRARALANILAERGLSEDAESIRQLIDIVLVFRQ